MHLVLNSLDGFATQAAPPEWDINSKPDEVEERGAMEGQQQLWDTAWDVYLG